MHSIRRASKQKVSSTLTKMKKSLKTLLAVAALGLATAANAALIPASGTVSLTNSDFDGGLNGGEFHGSIAGFGNIYTFCMEINQTLTLPGTYNFVSSNKVDSNGDVLSKGTAYLYQTFLAGSLFDRNGTLGNGVAGTHDNNSGLLQAAIWYLEDEVDGTWSKAAAFITGNPFIAQAVSKFGSLAGAKADYTGNKVAVLNLKTASGKPRQDVLIAVPDSGTTLALLGLAFLGLAAVRRRR